MTLQQLHYAITIAEAGSLNKADWRIEMKEKGLLLVISGFSGAGKGTGNFDLCKKRTGRIPDAGRIGISSLCKRGVWTV